MKAARLRVRRRRAKAFGIQMITITGITPMTKSDHRKEEPMTTNRETTSKSKRSQARSRYRFGWLEHVTARADLTPTEKVVLLRLGLHQNRKTGRCDPSYVGLAERCAVTERTAIRGIAKGIAKGLLVRALHGNGHGHRNQYKLVIPNTADERLSGQTVFNDAKADRPRQETLTGVSPEYSSNRASPTVRPKRERVRAARAPISGAALTAAPVEKADDAAKEDQIKKRAAQIDADAPDLKPVGKPTKNSRDESGVTRIAKSDTAEYAIRRLRKDRPDIHERVAHNKNDSFADLQLLWDRGWIEDTAAAEIAYTRAIRIVDPEVIIAAAQRWVTFYKAGDGVQYLPKLHNWLNDGGWLKTPPTRRQRNGHRMKNSDYMLEAAARLDAAERNGVIRWESLQ